MIVAERRPVVVAIAGPNGAGKSTFYATQLKDLGLPFVNADDLARQLALNPYEAASAADGIRRELAKDGRSFVFETVFSDPVGDKVNFLTELVADGYQVVLCYMGIPSAAVSEQRVAMRVSKGGHDVPAKKIEERYGRTLRNLSLAIRKLPEVRVYDNADLSHPYRVAAHFVNGTVKDLRKPAPKWLLPVFEELKRG